MAARFSLDLALRTIDVATGRILPQMLVFPPPLADTYIALNPLVSTAWFVACTIVVVILLSALTLSSGWMDRAWSLVPPIVAVMYAAHPALSQDRRTAGALDPRGVLMAACVCMWGLRLTAHAARRGYYTSGFEDYRYGFIRREVLTWRPMYCLAYAAFGCGFSTILLGLVTAPCYFAWIVRGEVDRLTPLDVAATLGFAACVAIETVADQQQYAFQCRKQAWHARSAADKGKKDKDGECPERSISDGFLQSGLFAYSRHPNYFAEVTTWWFFYLFSVATSGMWLNWCMLGPVLYTVLFQVSTPLTERISSTKYPAYKVYQQSVSRLIPSWPSRRASETSPTDARTKRD